MKVIVVDDEVLIAEAVGDLVKNQAQQLCESCIPKNCIACLLKQLNVVRGSTSNIAEEVMFGEPDLLITDLHMPEISGERLINSCVRTVPTIIFSGHEPRRALRTVSTYIPKPNFNLLSLEIKNQLHKYAINPDSTAKKVSNE